MGWVSRTGRRVRKLVFDGSPTEEQSDSVGVAIANDDRRAVVEDVEL